MHSEIIWTSTEAEAVTGGHNTCAWYATGVAINIEEMKPGDLYIATKDDNLEEVFRRGAAAAVVAAGQAPSGDMPLLEVGSVFEALQDLARAARYKTHATIIAVQSRKARLKIHDVLKHVGDVHEGGRHLSLGLAGVPENVEYGLFGFSPFAQPDIAVITNCNAPNCDMVFETMPVHGTVLIESDHEDFLSVVARAKAAGIQNIMTFGSSAQADARIVESLCADNGTRISVKILDEEHGFTIAPGEQFDPVMAAGLLIAKISGKALARAMRGIEGSEKIPVLTPLAAQNVSLIDPVAQKAGVLPEAVFKVTNMIDFGFGRQTAILDNLGNFSQKSLCFPKKDLVIPKRIDNLDFMYTSKTIGAVRNAHEAIGRDRKNARIEQISPDALVPGDFVVFKDIRKHSRAAFSEALRLIPALHPKKIRTPHAI